MLRAVLASLVFFGAAVPSQAQTDEVSQLAAQLVGVTAPDAALTTALKSLRTEVLRLLGQDSLEAAGLVIQSSGNSLAIDEAVTELHGQIVTYYGQFETLDAIVLAQRLQDVLTDDPPQQYPFETREQLLALVGEIHGIEHPGFAEILTLTRLLEQEIEADHPADGTAVAYPHDVRAALLTLLEDILGVGHPGQDDIRVLAMALEEAIDQDVASHAELVYALPLQQQLLSVSGTIHDLTLPQILEITQLAAELGGEITMLEEPVASTVLPDLNDLRMALLDLEAEFPRAAFTRRVDDLIAYLAEPPSGAAPVAGTATPAGPAFDASSLRAQDIARLVELRDRIDGLIEAETVAGIHVRGAQFGRISGGEESERCDITAAVRQHCQGQQTCNLPAAGFGTTDAAFCGLDHAPLALGADRGAVVWYGCLTQTRDEWEQTLATNDLPVHPQTTVLRSENDHIQCVLPAQR